MQKKKKQRPRIAGPLASSTAATPLEEDTSTAATLSIRRLETDTCIYCSALVVIVFELVIELGRQLARVHSLVILMMMMVIIIIVVVGGA